jgi:hypothetical protein
MCAEADFMLLKIALASSSKTKNRTHTSPHTRKSPTSNSHSSLLASCVFMYVSERAHDTEHGMRDVIPCSLAPPSYYDEDVDWGFTLSYYDEDVDWGLTLSYYDEDVDWGLTFSYYDEDVDWGLTLSYCDEDVDWGLTLSYCDEDVDWGLT